MPPKRQKHNVGNDIPLDQVTIEQGVNRFAQPNGQSGFASSSRHDDLQERLLAQKATHQAELEKLDEEIRKLQSLRKEHARDITDIDLQLDGLNKRVVRSHTVKNYFDKFEWSDRLREQLRNVFGIENFRLAQEGVCNANMDGRDIICIMPTGGGKSLTYQLPATLIPGCTLVISPLVSLMKDQILHLQENNIECLMFTASMSKREMDEAYGRLTATAVGKDPNLKEVKLCYATPEKMVKSNKFKALIQAMADGKKLARIVVDEAHCVSQQGHDFRPDYKDLSKFRLFYPDVPILALSATCPPKVLRDLIAILRLAPPTDGRDAAPTGTVKFTSPLYRSNLHYKIMQKSSVSAQVVRHMMDYILEHYPNETGIVYCLSRNDSEQIAAELFAVSEGRIKTGVYHAEIKDRDKEELHENWHLGKVKVMCATIAFGLGIDKKNVRFVIHHSFSKSVETFYQESGRAGRDGKDADCILYYRLHDALRMPGMAKDTEWEHRINGMIKFCLDFQGCRKLAFAEYFASCDWATDPMQCGHCDNCTRDPASVIERDVTIEAKRVLAVTRALFSVKFDVTPAQLAQAVRGSGSGLAATKKAYQLAPGDDVTLSPLDTDLLIAHMLVKGYLDKVFKETLYKVQVYVKQGPLSRRLDEGENFVIPFLAPVRASRNRSAKGAASSKKRKAGPHPRISEGSTRVHTSEDEDEDEDVIDISGEFGEEDDAFQEDEPGPSSKRRRSGDRSSWVPTRVDDAMVDDDTDDGSESEDEWKGNLRGAPVVTHRTLRTSPRKASGSGIVEMPCDDEIIEISE